MITPSVAITGTIDGIAIVIPNWTHKI